MGRPFLTFRADTTLEFQPARPCGLCGGYNGPKNWHPIHGEYCNLHTITGAVIAHHAETPDVREGKWSDRLNLSGHCPDCGSFTATGSCTAKARHEAMSA